MTSKLILAHVLFSLLLKYFKSDAVKANYMWINVYKNYWHFSFFYFPPIFTYKVSKTRLCSLGKHNINCGKTQKQFKC